MVGTVKNIANYLTESFDLFDIKQSCYSICIETRK